MQIRRYPSVVIGASNESARSLYEGDGEEDHVDASGGNHGCCGSDDEAVETPILEGRLCAGPKMGAGEPYASFRRSHREGVGPVSRSVLRPQCARFPREATDRA